jgi:hypothetical protein
LWPAKSRPNRLDWLRPRFEFTWAQILRRRQESAQYEFVSGFGRNERVAVLITLMVASSIAAALGSIAIQAHLRTLVCSRLDAIGQRRTERTSLDLREGRLRHREPSSTDQKKSGLGRNVHKTVSADAIAPNAVVGLVLAKRSTQRYQLGHQGSAVGDVGNHAHRERCVNS